MACRQLLPIFTKQLLMANLNESQQDLMTLYGAQCAAVVGYNSGMLQGNIGSGVALLLTAAGHTEVVRAKIRP